MITPLGQELRELAKLIVKDQAEPARVEQVRSARRELGRLLTVAGDSPKQIAKAAGVSRFAAHAWIDLADYPASGLRLM